MKRAILVLVGFLSAMGCTASDDIPAPQLSTVSPMAGRPGSVVTITGAYLCQQPNTGDEDPLSCANMGSVEFGTSPGTTTLWSDSTVSVEIPNVAMGSVELSATVMGRNSNTLAFTVE